MLTHIETHPAGVAVIVPHVLAARVGLHSGEPAEVELSGGGLVVRPSGPTSLANLLAGITPDNLHGEWAAGPPAGAEQL